MIEIDILFVNQEIGKATEMNKQQIKSFAYFLRKGIAENPVTE